MGRTEGGRVSEYKGNLEVIYVIFPLFFLSTLKLWGPIIKSQPQPFIVQYDRLHRPRSCHDSSCRVVDNKHNSLCYSLIMMSPACPTSWVLGGLSLSLTFPLLCFPFPFPFIFLSGWWLPLQATSMCTCSALPGSCVVGSMFLHKLQILFWLTSLWCSMIGENRQLVTDEPVEFGKSPVEGSSRLLQEIYRSF